MRFQIKKIILPIELGFWKPGESKINMLQGCLAGGRILLLISFTSLDSSSVYRLTARRRALSAMVGLGCWLLISLCMEEDRFIDPRSVPKQWI